MGRGSGVGSRVGGDEEWVFEVPFFPQLCGPTDSMEGEVDFFDLFSS